MTETALVTWLRVNRTRMKSRHFWSCLALARLNPKPTRRFTADELMGVLQCRKRSYVSHVLSELRRVGLVDYEAGTPGDPGYLFWRVGPEQGRGHQ
jgi:hypothetical protein